MALLGFVCAYVLVSSTFAVVEEGSEATAVQVVQDGQQEALIELKGCGKLTVSRKERAVSRGEPVRGGPVPAGPVGS